MPDDVGLEVWAKLYVPEYILRVQKFRDEKIKQGFMF